MANELQHIKDNQVHESIFNSTSHRFSWGPLEINFSVDLNPPQVTFTVYLAKVKIGSGTINAQNPCVKVGGGAAGFKAEAELCVDVAKKQVTYDVTVCAPIVGCQSKKGILFSC
ncbi:MAG TPA: hypothetical protein VF173_18055 [Thermoanaerobaculia bacterium]|nr:hypothetical protein [Thermoanaerobaculia bacterium]